MKCCNCGGEHSSAYRGCKASKRATEVQRIKISQGITYAEAAKKVTRKEMKRVSAETTHVEACKGCHEIKEDMLIVGKNEFLLFIVDIINCSAQTDRKTEKSKIIVKSAEKYLGMKELHWEEVEKILNGGPPNSQAWAGGSSWS